MEVSKSCVGVIEVYSGYMGVYSGIEGWILTENEMEREMEHEMETEGSGSRFELGGPNISNPIPSCSGHPFLTPPEYGDRRVLATLGIG